MPPLANIQKQARDFVGALTVKQRMLLIGAGIVTVAVVIGFAGLMATPDYKPLVTGMEASDAEALGVKLAAKNIPYRVGSDGKSVEVPSDKLDASRMEIASDGMPRSGRLGFELFDKMNWGQTEFDEKVNYQRALEGELERSIQTLKDVESVRVHLVMPVQSVFILMIRILCCLHPCCTGSPIQRRSPSAIWTEFITDFAGVLARPMMQQDRCMS